MIYHQEDERPAKSCISSYNIILAWDQEHLDKHSRREDCRDIPNSDGAAAGMHRVATI